MGNLHIAQAAPCNDFPGWFRRVNINLPEPHFWQQKRKLVI